MWIIFALLSAVCLGFYDVFKKQALRDNAVVPVLLVNTLLCALFFFPLIVGSAVGAIAEGSIFYVVEGTLTAHVFVLLKALLVLSSWLCGYFAMKHLPLTIVGPVNATRPVMTLIGALLIYNECLNIWQWIGVVIAVVAYFLLRRTGKKEGISFGRNLFVWLLVIAAILGAASGLYDKFLLAPEVQGGLGIDRIFVQAWYNLYQAVLMTLVLIMVWLPVFRKTDVFKWRWSIPLISIFLTAADLAYFYALSCDGSLIAVVSMVRRSSVLVSFLFGVMVLRERNAKSKAFDLFLVVLSLLFLLIGTL